MQTNDFYLTLPSNASSDLFTNNLPGEYRTKLAYPVTLRGKWECALAEISYPRSWNLITEDAELGCQVRGKEARNITIPKGFYSSVKEVIDEIRGQWDETERESFEMLYNPKTHLLIIYVKPGCLLVWQHNDLSKVLGILGNRDWIRSPVMIGSKRHTAGPLNMDLDLHSLYVYTDVIAPSLVGNTCVPLLRIVPVDGKYGDVVMKTYDKLHYVPLRSSTFECIEINIADNSGKMVQFEFGRVVVKLHVRPQRLAYL
jgi:hypothetical protein